MWLTRPISIALVALFTCHLTQAFGDGDNDYSGSGSSAEENASGANGEDVKKVVSQMKKINKDTSDSDLSNHIKKENHVSPAAPAAGHKIKQPNINPGSLSRKNSQQSTQTHKRRITKAADRDLPIPSLNTQYRSNTTMVKSYIPQPKQETKREEIPGIIQALPVLGAQFGIPFETPIVRALQSDEEKRSDEPRSPKLRPLKEKVEDNVPWSMMHATTLAPDVLERYEHTSDEARQEIGSNAAYNSTVPKTSNASYNTTGLQSHHGTATMPIKGGRRSHMTSKRGRTQHRFAKKSYLKHKQGSLAGQKTVHRRSRGRHRSYKKQERASNSYFMRPEKMESKELDIRRESEIPAAVRANIANSEDPLRKSHSRNDRKFIFTKVDHGKPKAKNKTSFKRFPGGKITDIDSKHDDIFSEALAEGSNPLQFPIPGEGGQALTDQPFFPLAFEKLPAQILADAAGSAPSPPSQIAPAAAASTPPAEVPPVPLVPAKAKEDDSSTTEITLTAQPNEQLVNEIKGIEARVGVLEAAVNQIRESVDTIKKDLDKQQQPVEKPHEESSISEEISEQPPLMFPEMILESLKKQEDEGPKIPDQLQGGPLQDDQSENPFVKDSGPAKAHELKELFIPLPPRHSNAENEIEEGAPIPGLPFPFNFVVSKVLKKMLKAREDRDKQGPGTHLTPVPDQDIPPTEHDIGQLETEIGPPFDHVFAPEEPAAVMGNPVEDEAAEKPKGPAIMEITFSKSEKEPSGCSNNCLNGGYCVDGNSCKCPPFFSGTRCERFSFIKKLKPGKQIQLEQIVDEGPGEPNLDSVRSGIDALPFAGRKMGPGNLFNMLSGFVRQLAKQTQGSSIKRRSLIPRQRPAAVYTKNYNKRKH